MHQITIDAKNQPLGRLAAKISLILQGKHSVSYQKNRKESVAISITNISLLKLTGKKINQKTYRHHTGYLGHLKKEKMKDIFKKNPGEVLRRAVYGMLPKNKLRDKRIKQLKIA